MTMIANLDTVMPVTTMTSLEIVAWINKERQEVAGAGGKAYRELQHRDFMRKATDVLGEGAAAKFFAPVQYINGGGALQTRNVGVYPKREACLMAMSYSWDMQAKVYDHMTELEAAVKLYEEGLKAVSKAEDLSEAQAIADYCLAKRQELRKSFNLEVKPTLAYAFVKGTCGAGRDVGMVSSNYMKLISMVAVGVSPSKFAKEHEGLSPRDWAEKMSDDKMLNALMKAEAAVLALVKADMDYATIKGILLKDSK